VGGGGHLVELETILGLLGMILYNGGHGQGEGEALLCTKEREREGESPAVQPLSSGCNGTCVRSACPMCKPCVHHVYTMCPWPQGFIIFKRNSYM
jgi:hypothetical protein